MKKINKKEFEQLNGYKYFLVKFGTPWCGPCRNISNQLKKIDGIDMFEINTDENPELVTEFEISSIPVICIFKIENNKKVLIRKHIGGNLDINTFQQYINELI